MRSTISISTTDKQVQSSTFQRAVNIALWVLQALLAAAFVAHGWFMVAPPADMVAMINANMGQELRIFVGVAELLAAVGLLAPGATRILPWLTACAAAGLMIVMASATSFHLLRGENESAVSTAILFVLVTLVAYGRWKAAPIASRR
jgi:uncharacterized membrane protein YphA (DoxX/SURF4 family)